MDSLFCASVINIWLVQKRINQGIVSQRRPIAKERMMILIDRKNCIIPIEYLEWMTNQGIVGLLYKQSIEWQRLINSYKPKTVKTMIGEVAFIVTQVRESSLYPDSLERGIRNELGCTALDLISL